MARRQKNFDYYAEEEDYDYGDYGDEEYYA